MRGAAGCSGAHFPGAPFLSLLQQSPAKRYAKGSICTSFGAVGG